MSGGEDLTYQLLNKTLINLFYSIFCFNKTNLPYINTYSDKHSLGGLCSSSIEVYIRNNIRLES